VTAQPNVTLTAAHVPAHCGRARTLLLGPLTPADLDAASFINAPQGVATAAKFGPLERLGASEAAHFELP
jgi:hypothetical protein